MLRDGRRWVGNSYRDKFLSGDKNALKWTMVIAACNCEYTKNDWTAQFKWVSSMFMDYNSIQLFKKPVLRCKVFEKSLSHKAFLLNSKSFSETKV